MACTALLRFLLVNPWVNHCTFMLIIWYNAQHSPSSYTSGFLSWVNSCRSYLALIHCSFRTLGTHRNFIDLYTVYEIYLIIIIIIPHQSLSQHIECFGRFLWTLAQWLDSLLYLHLPTFWCTPLKTPPIGQIWTYVYNNTIATQYPRNKTLKHDSIFQVNFISTISDFKNVLQQQHNVSPLNFVYLLYNKCWASQWLLIFFAKPAWPL